VLSTRIDVFFKPTTTTIIFFVTRSGGFGERLDVRRAKREEISRFSDDPERHAGNCFPRSPKNLSVPPERRKFVARDCPRPGEGRAFSVRAAAIWERKPPRNAL